MSIRRRTLNAELCLIFDDNTVDVDTIKTALEVFVSSMMHVKYNKYRVLSADWTYDLEDAEDEDDDVAEGMGEDE